MVFITKSLTSSFLFLMLFLVSSNIFQFVVGSFTLEQIGVDISFGQVVSVAGDGKTIALGSQFVGLGGIVRVYRYNANIDKYVQLGPDIDEITEDEFFGGSLSISADGKTIVATANTADTDSGRASGIVRVYRFNAKLDIYTQVGADISGKVEFDYFGTSVSISTDGTTFVATAPGNDARSRARIFRFNSNIDSYAQVGLDLDGDTIGTEFGRSVSISGDGTTIAVGAPFNATDRQFPGIVTVYRLNDKNDALVKVVSVIEGENASDGFGASVSISSDGSAIAVGAVYNDGNGDQSGSVRVYRYNENIDSYVQYGSDIDGEAANDFFGISVSISGDGTTIVVGATNNAGNGVDSGSVRVYRLDANIDRYIQIGPDIDGENRFDGFGDSVSISADGTTVAASAFRRSDVGVYKIVAQEEGPINCNVSWSLFNSKTDSFVANLSNGTTITTKKVPPCNFTNIQAVVSCVDTFNAVTIELYQNNKRVQRRVERSFPYFLFGNKGKDINNGRIAPGTHRIRARVNGQFSPFTTFTLMGPDCNK